MQRLAGRLPVAPVLDLAQALDNPYALSVGMVQPVPHPALPGLRMVANPVKVDGERTPAAVCSPLGADTEALLSSLGLSGEQLAQLRDRKVIR
jgi:crotonobetainyl-CoA:carnitine CoA-transferase CaiB-like acyl-CoA transferase